MDEPIFRKPIFGAVWRYPEADLQRLQRVGRRGVLRLIILIPLTLLVVSLLAISIVYATSGISFSEAILIGFVLATGTVLVLRGWMLGTFVNENGFKIVTLLRSTSGLWKNEYEVETRPTGWKMAGIPIGITSRRVLFITSSGGELKTHVYLGSVDGIFTFERFDVLFQLLRRWSAPK